MADTIGKLAEEQLAADPMYQQVVSDRNLTEPRIRYLPAHRGSAAVRHRALPQRLEAAPMVEQELAATQREADLERKLQTPPRAYSSPEQEHIGCTRGGNASAS